MGQFFSNVDIKDSRSSLEENMEDIPEDNGLVLNGVFLPEELVLQMLTYFSLTTLSKCSLVCKKWNEIISSQYFWKTKCSRSDKLKAKITNKNLPSYAYYALLRGDFFDLNFIKNNCGQERLAHWEIKSNGGDEFIVECPPVGTGNLPENQPEFNGLNSCFATSYQNCSKSQAISFKGNKLFEKILDELRPKIYVSEWYAPRFDCGSKYKLSIWLLDKSNKLLQDKCVEMEVHQWGVPEWKKVEFTLNCPKGLREINFYHSGRDTQFWAGHYGSKMSGAVVKILWDSIAR